MDSSTSVCLLLCLFLASTLGVLSRGADIESPFICKHSLSFSLSVFK